MPPGQAFVKIKNERRRMCHGALVVYLYLPVDANLSLLFRVAAETRAATCVSPLTISLSFSLCRHLFVCVRSSIPIFGGILGHLISGSSRHFPCNFNVVSPELFFFFLRFFLLVHGGFFWRDSSRIGGLLVVRSVGVDEMGVLLD